MVGKKTDFIVTQKDRKAFVLQLQFLLSDWHTDANDLEEGDAGIEGRGRVASKGRRAHLQGVAQMAGRVVGRSSPCNMQWTATATWSSGKISKSTRWRPSSARVSLLGRGQTRRSATAGTKLYRVVWKDWATDTATWEPEKTLALIC